MASEPIPSQDSYPPAETGRAPPSSLVDPPTGTDTPVRRASTPPLPPPGDGDDVRAEQSKKPPEVNRDDPNVNVVELPPHSPTFKEQVYGYARLIRGTVLGQAGVKEQGTQVLSGERGIPLRRGSQSSK